MIRLPLENAEVVIGRRADADICLPNPTVSRTHAMVTRKGGEITIVDADSANGTRVNGLDIRRTVLEPGDQIAIGPYRIGFDGYHLHEQKLGAGLSVEAKNVSLTTGDQQILAPTDLAIAPGGMLALIGPSGAGKTTLMKILSGTIAPSEGLVLCGGEPIGGRMSEIGYVPQFDLVHGALTVFEALDYAARLRLPPDTGSGERRTRVREVLEQLDLINRANLRVDQLSGGQRKRVSVGTEILHRPRLLFLDEPTTGLDPGLERTMMELFHELSRSGQTVVLVTHATASIELCDRVVVMGTGGVKRFEGTPRDVLKAFGVSGFEGVYQRLAKGYKPVRVGKGIGRVRGRRVVKDMSRRPRTKLGSLRQAAILSSRYALLMRRNPRNLISLAVQTILLGLLTTVIFESGLFEKLAVGKSSQLLFITVVIAIWIGCIGSAREIVKERGLVSRELAVGIDPNSYLASKFLVLFPLISIQIIGYFAVVTTIRDVQPNAVHVLLILITSGLVAMMIGLLVSASSRSQDQATSLIPMMMVPQLLFGGALVTINKMPAAGEIIAALIPARWSYEAAGTALGFSERLHERVPREGSTKGLELQRQANELFSADLGGNFFNLSMPHFSLIMAAFVVAIYILLLFAISKFQTS